MAPGQLGNHHAVLQEEVPGSSASGAQPIGFMGLLTLIYLIYPLSTRQSKLTAKPPSTRPDKGNLFWAHLEILKTLLSVARVSPQGATHRQRKQRAQEQMPVLSGQTNRPVPIVTKRQPSCLHLGPFDLRQGRANKKETGPLAFFPIHACFENITCLADYMIITLKGCQAASGIIIVWFAGFRAHGNTSVLGAFFSRSRQLPYSHSLRLLLDPDEDSGRLIVPRRPGALGAWRARAALTGGLVKSEPLTGDTWRPSANKSKNLLRYLSCNRCKKACSPSFFIGAPKCD